MFLLKLFYAALGILLGIGILKYRKTVYEWTGRFYWAEKYLWSGGTVVVITLVGIGLIFVSIAYPFGAFDRTLQNPGAQSGNTKTSESRVSE